MLVDELAQALHSSTFTGRTPIPPAADAAAGTAVRPSMHSWALQMMFQLLLLVENRLLRASVTFALRLALQC